MTLAPMVHQWCYQNLYHDPKPQEPKVDGNPKLLQHAAKGLTEQGVYIKSCKHHFQRKFST